MTTQPQAVIAVTPALPNRRNAELLLLGFAAVITAVALLIVEANQEQGVRWDLAQSVLAYLALFGAAHMAIRRYAPYAGPLGCWEYQGARTASVRFDGRRRRIHRVVYELATGEQLGELVVTAKCENTKCLNPSHLAAVTKKQVQHRRDRANRNNRNSDVRNVYSDRERWRAQLIDGGKAVGIGTFDTVAQADAAVRKVRAHISATPG